MTNFRATTILINLFQILAITNAASLSVIELGAGGTLHEAADFNGSDEISLFGLHSFWDNLHSNSRQLTQVAGMKIVPDMFDRPSAGLVIGLKGEGLDLQAMPHTSQMLARAVGGSSMKIKGASAALEGIISDASALSTLDELAAYKPEADSKFNKLIVDVNSNNDAGKVDEVLQRFLSQIVPAPTTETLVLHLIVQDSEDLERRRLNEDEQNNSGNSQDEDRNNNNNMNNCENDQDCEQQANAGYSTYYGYGFKSIYQIQLYNVTLWSALGLTFVLVFCLGLMINMPLMPDSLLFGESAKMMGE